MINQNKWVEWDKRRGKGLFKAALKRPPWEKRNQGWPLGLSMRTEWNGITYSDTESFSKKNQEYAWLCVCTCVFVYMCGVDERMKILSWTY